MPDNDRAQYWTQANPFPDVELNQWFNNAVSTTTNADIFMGMPDGNFQPSRAITRAEFAAAVVRFMNVQHREVAPLFNDIAGHWATNYISTAASLGWVMGYEGLDGQFLPNQAITRAEAAAMINRMLSRLPKTPHDLLQSMRIWPDNMNPAAWYYLHIQEATNSHYYEMKEDNIHEKWIKLILPERPWHLLELPTSTPEDIRQER